MIPLSKGNFAVSFASNFVFLFLKNIKNKSLISQLQNSQRLLTSCQPNGKLSNPPLTTCQFSLRDNQLNFNIFFGTTFEVDSFGIRNQKIKKEVISHVDEIFPIQGN
jgi:hypothetical protein